MKKNCVILKWNPAISSYSMCRFLNNISWSEPESDWSIYDYDRVKAGDQFFMLKVGIGTSESWRRAESPAIRRSGRIGADGDAKSIMLTTSVRLWSIPKLCRSLNAACWKKTSPALIGTADIPA